MGSEGSNIAFGMNNDVRMISLISKEWENTSSSARSIIVGKLQASVEGDMGRNAMFGKHMKDE